MSERNGALEWQLRQEMERIAEAGRTAYLAGQLAQAAELYGRAKQIAEQVDDPRFVEYGASQGNSLMRTGQIRQALAVLAPLIRVVHDDVEPWMSFDAMANFLDCALRLPSRLAEISGALRVIRTFLHDTGNVWRPALLLLEHDLFSACGLYEQALDTAEEALRLRLGATNVYGYFVDDHYRFLISTALDHQDDSRAEELLAEWEGRADHEEVTFPIDLAVRRSKLARLRDLPEAAWTFIRPVLAAARQAGSKGTRLNAFREYVRVLLATGQLSEIPEILSGVAWARASESGHDRYLYWLLTADYHLALARQAAGMPPVDDEFGKDFPPPDHIADPAATRVHLGAAREAYAKADEVGRWIDGQLECSWRTEQVAERLRRVQVIENACG